MTFVDGLQFDVQQFLFAPRETNMPPTWCFSRGLFVA